MADDCAALGFKMDCGHDFERVYGADANNSDELDKVIDDVTNISLLGSAIYSRWKHFNHWAWGRNHPICRKVPTSILYGSTDNLQSIETIKSFADKNGCDLTIMENASIGFIWMNKWRFWTIGL